MNRLWVSAFDLYDVCSGTIAHDDNGVKITAGQYIAGGTSLKIRVRDNRGALPGTDMTIGKTFVATRGGA